MRICDGLLKLLLEGNFTAANASIRKEGLKTNDLQIKTKKTKSQLNPK